MSEQQILQTTAAVRPSNISKLWKLVWLHLYALLIALDVLLSALTGGGPYKTISCRLGQSMMNNGWASRVPWPAWWRAHCTAAVYMRVV